MRAARSCVALSLRARMYAFLITRQRRDQLTDTLDQTTAREGLLPRPPMLWPMRTIGDSFAALKYGFVTISPSKSLPKSWIFKTDFPRSPQSLLYPNVLMRTCCKSGSWGSQACGQKNLLSSEYLQVLTEPPRSPCTNMKSTSGSAGSCRRVRPYGPNDLRDDNASVSSDLLRFRMLRGLWTGKELLLVIRDKAVLKRRLSLFRGRSDGVRCRGVGLYEPNRGETTVIPHLPSFLNAFLPAWL